MRLKRLLIVKINKVAYYFLNWSKNNAKHLILYSLSKQQDTLSIFYMQVAICSMWESNQKD